MYVIIVATYIIYSSVYVHMLAIYTLAWYVEIQIILLSTIDIAIAIASSYSYSKKLNSA